MASPKADRIVAAILCLVVALGLGILGISLLGVFELRAPVDGAYVPRELPLGQRQPVLWGILAGGFVVIWTVATLWAVKALLLPPKRQVPPEDSEPLAPPPPEA